MDFGYSPEQQSLQDEVRRFIAEHVTPELRDEIEAAAMKMGAAPW